MHISSFHPDQKALQTKVVFTAKEGKTISIQMEKNAELKEHITKVPAFLICISGEVIFENELGFKETLRNGDTINIAADVKHWLIASLASNLVLIK